MTPIPEMTVAEVLEKTDWAMLAQQKLALVEGLGGTKIDSGVLEGLLNFLDHLQDAAEAEGYPVVFLMEEEPEA